MLLNRHLFMLAECAQAFRNSKGLGECSAMKLSDLNGVGLEFRADFGP